jgi:hypothetical protein
MVQLMSSGVEAVILDDNQSQSVCVYPSSVASGIGSLADAAAVCPGAPVPEAGSIPTQDSGAGADAEADAGSDAAVDATVADAPADVAPEDAADATVDGPADAAGGDAGAGDSAVDAAAGG